MKGNYELWILNFELRDKKAIMKGKLGTEPLFFWRLVTGGVGNQEREDRGSHTGPSRQEPVGDSGCSYPFGHSEVLVYLF